MDLKTAERLARLRKEHGYSQEELAERLGVSRQAVSKWERGESSPDTDNLIALAVLYGISLDEMLSFDGTNRKAGGKGAEDDRENGAKDDAGAKEYFSVRTDGGEEVRIGKDGLRVDDGKGRRVQIAPFKIDVTSSQNDERFRWNGEDERTRSDKNGDGAERTRSKCGHFYQDGAAIHVNGVPIFTRGRRSGDSPTKCAVVGALHGIVFFATLAVFLLWGFLGGEARYYGDWGHSWLVWFAWPTLASLIEAVAYRDFNKFAYPVFITGVYLTVGMYLSVWHPAWVMFLTIPIYYFIVEFIKKLVFRAKERD